jgi:hypothetical protein
MSIESDLCALLEARCPRTFPGFAPVSTPRPYVTYQGIGGRPLRYVDNTAADKRNSVKQINVWADTLKEALILARQIEEDLCAASQFTAIPESEPIEDYDADVPVYGTRQDFSIYGAR